MKLHCSQLIFVMITTTNVSLVYGNGLSTPEHYWTPTSQTMQNEKNSISLQTMRFKKSSETMMALTATSLAINGAKNGVTIEKCAELCMELPMCVEWAYKVNGGGCRCYDKPFRALVDQSMVAPSYINFGIWVIHFVFVLIFWIINFSGLFQNKIAKNMKNVNPDSLLKIWSPVRDFKTLKKDHFAAPVRYRNFTYKVSHPPGRTSPKMG